VNDPHRRGFLTAAGASVAALGLANSGRAGEIEVVPEPAALVVAPAVVTITGISVLQDDTVLGTTPLDLSLPGGVQKEFFIQGTGFQDADIFQLQILLCGTSLKSNALNHQLIHFHFHRVSPGRIRVRVKLIQSVATGQTCLGSVPPPATGDAALKPQDVGRLAGGDSFLSITVINPDGGMVTSLPFPAAYA
jgi:hypothetical protein